MSGDGSRYSGRHPHPSLGGQPESRRVSSPETRNRPTEAGPTQHRPTMLAHHGYSPPFYQAFRDPAPTQQAPLPSIRDLDLGWSRQSVDAAPPRAVPTRAEPPFAAPPRIITPRAEPLLARDHLFPTIDRYRDHQVPAYAARHPDAQRRQSFHEPGSAPPRYEPPNASRPLSHSGLPVSGRTASHDYRHAQPPPRRPTPPAYAPYSPAPVTSADYSYPARRPMSEVPIRQYTSPPLPFGPGHQREVSNSGTSADRPPVPVSQYSNARGDYYLYSDGSSVPVTIGGQTVNPHHGITKQGNPRKRGSHACGTCRSKKVKCEVDPEDPGGRCRACARSGHECQWTTGSLRDTAGTPDQIFDTRQPGSAGGSRRAGPTSSNGSPDSPVPAPNMRPSTSSKHPSDDVIQDEQLYKRPRMDHRDSGLAVDPRPPPGLIQIHPAHDLFGSPRHVIEHSLRPYFAYRDTGCTKILPQEAFRRYVLSDQHTSLSEAMVVYACLAVGSIYASQPGSDSTGTDAYNIARQLEEEATHADCTMELALTRLYLALYTSAKGDTNRSIAYIASGISALNAMHYNTEAGCINGADEDAKKNPFHMPRSQFIECRRRVFWLGYLVERFNGYCAGYTTLLADADIFVRLPNNNEYYERGTLTAGPFLAEGLTYPSTTRGSLVAANILITSMWGAVCSNIYRTAHRPLNTTYASDFVAFSLRTTASIESWHDSLPTDLRYRPENTARNLHSPAKFASYYTLQSTHHAILLNLHRHFRHEALPTETTKAHLRLAYNTAKQWLRLVSAVSKRLITPTTTRDVSPSADTASAPTTSPLSGLEAALAQPFPALTTLSALSILTHSGPSSTLETIFSSTISSLRVLDIHARTFASARLARDKVNERMTLLAGWRVYVSSPQSEGGRGMSRDNTVQEGWRVDVPAEGLEGGSLATLGMDAVYGVDLGVWGEVVAACEGAGRGGVTDDVRGLT